MPLLRIILWIALAIPGALMIRALASGDVLAMDLYHPSGELSLRLMLIAMMVGPLLDIFRPNRFLRSWLAIRRNLGVAAFAYAVLHLVFYVVDMRTLAAMLDEIALPSIATGWLSFALMLAAASVSNDWAVRKLGRNWKRIQRCVYAAFLLGAVHWWLLDRDPIPPLVHLAPLLILWSLRWTVSRQRRKNQKEPAT